METTVDTRALFSVLAFLLIILIAGIAGQCSYQEQPLPNLTPSQRAEVISRMGGHR